MNRIRRFRPIRPRLLVWGLIAALWLAAGAGRAHEAEQHGAPEGATAPGATGQGTMGQGTTGQGMMGQGTMGQGMMGQGATGQGTMGQGMMGRDMPMMPGMDRLMMPAMDAERGRRLFASKGCVACHAVNGVGGHDATPLDAHTMTRVMNPFDFAAKMWRMAPMMIYAQEEALGEQILFTGEELADIIAFVHDDEEQHKFSEADIPPKIREWMGHSHGEPGGGAGAHGEELGPTHHHDEEEDDDAHGDD
jgi:hypothetical protein